MLNLDYQREDDDTPCETTQDEEFTDMADIRSDRPPLRDAAQKAKDAADFVMLCKRFGWTRPDGEISSAMVRDMLNVSRSLTVNRWLHGEQDVSIQAITWMRKVDTFLSWIEQNRRRIERVVRSAGAGVETAMDNTDFVARFLSLNFGTISDHPHAREPFVWTLTKLSQAVVEEMARGELPIPTDLAEGLVDITDQVADVRKDFGRRQGYHLLNPRDGGGEAGVIEEDEEDEEEPQAAAPAVASPAQPYLMQTPQDQLAALFEAAEAAEQQQQQAPAKPAQAVAKAAPKAVQPAPAPAALSVAKVAKVREPKAAAPAATAPAPSATRTLLTTEEMERRAKDSQRIRTAHEHLRWPVRAGAIALGERYSMMRGHYLGNGPIPAGMAEWYEQIATPLATRPAPVKEWRFSPTVPDGNERLQWALGALLWMPGSDLARAIGVGSTEAREMAEGTRPVTEALLDWIEFAASGIREHPLPDGWQQRVQHIWDPVSRIYREHAIAGQSHVEKKAKVLASLPAPPPPPVKGHPTPFDDQVKAKVAVQDRVAQYRAECVAARALPDKADKKAALAKALASYDGWVRKREAEMRALRFDPNDPWTLEDIGHRYGISRQAVDILLKKPVDRVVKRGRPKIRLDENHATS